MIFKRNHRIDLSIIFSFTSFQAYYVNLGPSAAKKPRESTICFSRILAVYPIVAKITYLITEGDLEMSDLALFGKFSQLHMFLIIQIVLRIARCSRLFLRIDMILRKLKNTHDAC